MLVSLDIYRPAAQQQLKILAEKNNILSLPIVVTSGNVYFKHALEWNYFVGVILFYLFTYLFWKRS